MSKQTINIGASPNDGTGTPLRTSFDYTNQNFTELYTAVGPSGNNIVVPGNATITGDLTVDTSTLKVDSTNDRVGIGTTTPAYKLEVVAPAGNNIVSTFRSGDATAANNAGGGFQSISSATAASRVARVWLDADGADLSGGDYFFIQKNGNSGTVEFNQSSNAAMTFLTNGTERYRIASDGVATWSNVGGVAGTAMTLNSTGLGIGASPSNYRLYVSAAFASGLNGAYIESGEFNKKSLVVNHTNSGVAVNLFEVQKVGTALLTLDASGNLLIGLPTSAATNSGSFIFSPGTSSYGGVLSINHSTSNVSGSGFVNFNYNVTNIGSISQNGTTGVLYNIVSDYRLKESIVPLSGGLARVNALKPSVYNWKSDGSTGEGFLAHELAEVVPFAVTGEKDAVDKDGKIKAQGIDMSRVVPILVAAIQELTAEVNALKNA